MNTIISFTYYAKLLSNPLLESWVWQYSLSVNLEQLYAFVSNDWYICPISEVYRSEGIQYTLGKLQVPSYVPYGGFFKVRFSQISSIIYHLWKSYPQNVYQKHVSLSTLDNSGNIFLEKLK